LSCYGGGDGAGGYEFDVYDDDDDDGEDVDNDDDDDVDDDKKQSSAYLALRWCLLGHWCE
jgi:hypothetical protein